MTHLHHPQRTLVHPVTGQTLRLGRKRPPAGARPKCCAKLKDHMRLPVGPAAADYSPLAMESLHNIFGNDDESDCVIAAYYHKKGVVTGNVGALFVPTMAQINGDYTPIGGYDPNNTEVPNPTDGGCDENVAIDYWTTTGDCTGTKILGSVEVDGCNWPEVQSALWLFEGALTCLELPPAYTGNLPTGDDFVWDVASDASAKPDPDDGHGVMLAGYGPMPGSGKVGARLATWGYVGWATPEAVATYFIQSAGGSFNVTLTPDMLGKAMARCANGVDWTSLQTTLAAMKAAA